MTSPAPHWKIFGRIVCAVLWLGVSSVAWSVRGAEVAGGPASLASAPDLTPLWELDPLRVHCAVCVETAANWNDLRRQALADGILARCNTEFGQAWRMSANVATAAECATIERAVSGRTLADLEAMAEGELARDKWLLLCVRMSEPSPTLVAWEYDLASRRWSDGPVRPINDWQRLELMAFESLAEVCSPQALVKSVAGPRVVLRLRGGLLPVHNVRRAAGGVGSVFQVMGEQTATLVQVERRDGHLLECRTLGPPLPDQAAADAKETLAVQMRALHASTDVVFQVDAGETSPPLIGCEVWSSTQRDEMGRFLGRTDLLGRVQIVRGDASVVWLHLRRGSVLLESLPIVPGFCQWQRRGTRICPEMLQVAEAIALCCDDLAEVVALAESLRARVKSREGTGQADQAKALESSGKELLTQRVDALHQRWQARRAQVEQLVGKDLPGAAEAWKQLTAELNALRPSP